MKRLNLKLAISLVVGMLVMVAGVLIAHGLQQESTAGSLKKQAEELLQNGKKAEALKTYDAYLQQNEDDPDVYLVTSKLAVEIVDETPTKEAWGQAMSELTRAFRRHHDNAELRERFAKFDIEIGRYNEAREHLEWLTSRDRGPHAAKLDLMLATCYVKIDFISKAMKIYADLTGYDLETNRFIKKARAPDETDAYVFMATLMREKLDPKLPKEADAVMEQLVAVNKDSFKAHLARGEYLYKYADSESTKQDKRKAAAREELAAAEKLAPDDSSVILFGAQLAAGAQVAQQDKDFERAEKLLVRGLKLYPKNVEMYRQWAILNVDQNKFPEAQKKIEDGLKLMPNDLRLLWFLTEVKLQQRDLEGAQATIKILEAGGYTPVLIDLMRARIPFYEQKWLEAAQQLERLRPLLAGSPDHIKQADLFMAQCYEQLGQYDKQLEACRRVLGADKTNVAGLVGEASALMGLGKTLEAQKAYERIGKMMGSKTMLTPQIWVPIVELRISEVLKQPAEKRDWSQVDRLVDWMERNGSATDGSTALVKAEVQFRKNDLDGAYKTLDAARAKHPKDAALWSALASIVAQQKDKGPGEAIKLLDQVPEEIRSSTTMRLNRANMLTRQGGDHLATAIAELDAGSEKLSASERSRLWSGLGTALLQIVDRDGAMRFWGKVADADPSDLKIRFNLFDVARETGDERVMGRVLDDMRRTMGKNSVEAQYVQAAQSVALVRKAVRGRTKVNAQTAPLQSDEKETLAAARKLLNQVSQARPGWCEVAKVNGDAEILDGNMDGAIASYQTALKVGPLNPLTVKTLALLLSQQGRTKELSELIDQVGADNVKGLGMGRVDVEAKAMKKDFSAALKGAREQVKDDSPDPDGHMWVGHLYDRAATSEDADTASRKKMAEEAEAAFRRAVKAGPNLPNTWLVLVDHLVAYKKSREAAEVLMDARKELPEDRVNQVLGPGYEVLGEMVLAEQYYRAAIEAAPKDLATHRLVAMFFMRTGRMEDARKEVAFVLPGSQSDPKNKPHLLWARRALAEMLAESGDLDDFKKAKALLLANTKINSEDAEDQLHMANLLARRSDEPAMLRESLKWFDGVKTLSDQDRMTVAKIHEVLGDWSLAREEMLKLVSQQKPDPNTYLAFIEMLVRRNQISDAANWLDKLDAVKPAAGLLLRTRVLVKQGRANEAIVLLSQILPQRPVPKDQVSGLRTVALVLDQEGLNNKAEELYREYMSHEPATGGLQLAAFLGRDGRLDEALDLIETQINEQPLKPEARHTILQIVSEVLHGQPRRIQPRHLERVKGWFDRLLREDPESAPLLLQFADFQMIAGQDEKAEKLYRDVLNRSDINESQKAVAYKNLAFVLASERKNLPEALDLINRAGSELGLRSDILDTRGMVYLAMDKYPEAVADFSESVLVTSPSAVKLLHLAMAQDLSLDRLAAQKSFHRAKEAKLDSAALSKSEQAFYDRLLKDVGG